MGSPQTETEKVVEIFKSNHELNVTDEQLTFLEALTGKTGQAAVEHFIFCGTKSFALPMALQNSLDSLGLKSPVA